MALYLGREKIGKASVVVKNNDVKLQTKTVTPTASQQTISADSGYDGLSNVTVTGDNNLISENIKSGVSIFGVNGTLVSEEGNDSLIKAIEGGGVSIDDDKVEALREYAFYIHSNLITASFAACTNIGNSAFAYSPNLTSINFPACTNIGERAFFNCSNLATANFPVATNIGNYAFNMCRNLTTANFPVATNTGSYAFNMCSNLTEISFPTAESVGSYAFSGCSNLATANFPVATNIGNNAFNMCSNLTEISFPAAASIGSYAFSGCRTLSSLTLGASTVCTLANSSAFNSTPYKGYSSYFSGTPYIYVPASLVSAYKTTTNWTYFSKYISAINTT